MDRHVEELVAANPCTGYYKQGWLMNAWMEDRGWDEEQRKDCIHSKTTPGCPGCNDRVLRYWGIKSLTRWNPEAMR